MSTCRLAMRRLAQDCKAQALAYRPSMDAAEVQKVRDGTYLEVSMLLYVVVVT